MSSSCEGIDKRNWIPEYIQWLDSTNRLLQDMQNIAEKLKNYFTQFIFGTHEYHAAIAENLETTLGRCNHLTFTIHGETEAYVVNHFLDRFHRFQMMFLSLLKKGLFPLRQRNGYPIEVLDVGTGPGPALFSLCSVYRTLSDFGHVAGITSLINIEFNTDYVERSNGFRHFLHHFTEYSNLGKVSELYKIHYHHGTFDDFKEISFDQLLQYEDVDRKGDLCYRQHMKRYRYDLVIFSNFFTKPEHVNEFADDIRRSALYLRNRGTLLVAGASAEKSSDYFRIYSDIKLLIEGTKYNNSDYVGSCRESNSVCTRCEYNWSDKYGAQLKSFLRFVLDEIRKENATEHILKRTIDRLNHAVNESYDYPIVWEMRAFRRKSRYVGHNSAFRKTGPANTKHHSI
jgi:hypothetical protein